MRTQQVEASRTSNQSSPPVGPEVDYSPRTYSSREKLLLGVKLSVITVVVALLFWLIG